MLIPVTPAGAASQEWVLVELQGKVDTLTQEQQEQIGVLLQGIKAEDAVQLTIGYHQLEGKLLKLKKPLVIMEKAAAANGSSYQVQGVIRHKYLFKNRPKALISKPGP